MDFVQIILLGVFSILVICLIIKFFMFFSENQEEIKKGFLLVIGFSLWSFCLGLIFFFTIFVIPYLYKQITCPEYYINSKNEKVCIKK